MTEEPVPDLINHPPHYTSHPSGVEVITITRHMGFNLGNVVKYVLRCDLKQDAIEDLEKAAWYLADEIKRRKQDANAARIIDQLGFAEDTLDADGEVVHRRESDRSGPGPIAHDAVEERPCHHVNTVASRPPLMRCTMVEGHGGTHRNGDHWWSA